MDRSWYIVGTVVLVALAGFLIWWFAFRDDDDATPTPTSAAPVASVNTTTGVYEFAIGAFTNAGSDQSFVDWTNVDGIDVLVADDTFGPAAPFSERAGADTGNRYLRLGVTGKELTGTFRLGFEGTITLTDGYSGTLNLGIYVGGTGTTGQHLKTLAYTEVSEVLPPAIFFDGALTEYNTLKTIPADTEVYLTIEDSEGSNMAFGSTPGTSTFTISVI